MCVSGSNGKSLILGVLENLYGVENISVVEIADLVKEFQRINFLYSRLNIDTEETTNITGAEARIKKVITDDRIDGCYKNFSIFDYLHNTSSSRMLVIAIFIFQSLCAFYEILVT